MSPFSRLVDCIVALVDIRTRATVRAKLTVDASFDGLAQLASDRVRDALDALREIMVSYGDSGVVIGERDGATLRVTGMGLVHSGREAKVFVEDKHWTEGSNAILAVNGHSWGWPEMVEGVVAATKDVLDFACSDPVPRRKPGGRKSSYCDETTARLLKTAKSLIKVNFGGHDAAQVVQGKLADAGVTAGPVTIAAVIAMLEQTTETCRRAAFPRIDEAIARLEGTNEKEVVP